MQLMNALALVLATTAACKDDARPATADAPEADAVATDAAVDAVPIDAPRFCDSETRDDTYTPGMVKVGVNGYAFTLVSSVPAPPQKGNNAWVVQISHPDPVDGINLSVVPFMPDHGHGTAVQAVVTPTTNGTYNISPVNLFMTGFWSVRINVLDPAAGNAELDHVAFLFCVNST